MKKIAALIFGLVLSAQATERVTLSCNFEAVAFGYKDITMIYKLILDGDQQFYDDRGEKSDLLTNNGIYGFNFYDGKDIHILEHYCSYWNMGDSKKWDLNSGNLTCILSNGW